MVTQNHAAAFNGATRGSVGGVAEFGGVVVGIGLGTKLLEIPLGQLNTFAKSAGGVAFTTGCRGRHPQRLRWGMNGLTPGGAGTLVLVTPFKIVTNRCSGWPSPPSQPSAAAATSAASMPPVSDDAALDVGDALR